MMSEWKFYYRKSKDAETLKWLSSSKKTTQKRKYKKKNQHTATRCFILEQLENKFRCDDPPGISEYDSPRDEAKINLSDSNTKEQSHKHKLFSCQPGSSLSTYLYENPNGKIDRLCWTVQGNQGGTDMKGLLI